MKVLLSLETLSKLDNGTVPKQFDALVQAAMRDIEDRPHDTKPRKVVLTLDMWPRDVKADRVGFQFTFKSSVPAYKSDEHDATLKHVSGQKMGLFFNPESPDDVSQGTLDEAKAKLE